jgi:Tfp pilus assembly PilM family ATPase
MDEKSAREIVMRTGLHPHCGIRMTGHRQGETGIFNTLLEILKPELLHLVEEIDRAFMYAAAQARGGGETRICLLGSLARWPGVDRVLAELLNLPLSALANPLAPFGADEPAFAEQASTAEPEFAVATGLALRGLVDDD